MHATSAGRNVCLVPFVQRRNHRSKNPRYCCPSKCPGRKIGRGQSHPPGAKKQQAQNEITDDVPGLSHEKMPGFEVRRVHAKQEMKYRKEDTAGIVGDANLAGFDRDDSQPKPGGNPDFYNFIL